MIDVEYTAKNRRGTLSITTEEPHLAEELRRAAYRIQELTEAGQNFHVRVVPVGYAEAGR